MVDVTTGMLLKEFGLRNDWQYDLPFKILGKGLGLLIDNGAQIQMTTTTQVNHDDTSALIKESCYINLHKIGELNQLWSSGYSKAFMDWIATDIKPLQAWLLLKMIQADTANKSLSYVQGSLEHTILQGMPKNFQEYLIKRYSIAICAENPSGCPMQ